MAYIILHDDEADVLVFDDGRVRIELPCGADMEFDDQLEFRRWCASLITEVPKAYETAKIRRVAEELAEGVFSLTTKMEFVV